LNLPKLTKLELQIVEAVWSRGASSIREIQEAFPERRRPAYTTVQTTVYRMERKKVEHGPSFLAAIHEQLGLTLLPSNEQTARVEALVIDHAERLTGNQH